MCSLIFLRSLNIFLDLCPRLQVCFIGFQSFGYSPCNLDHCVVLFFVFVFFLFVCLFACFFVFCPVVLNLFFDFSS